MATTTNVSPVGVMAATGIVVEQIYNLYDSVDATNDGSWINMAGVDYIVIENTESSFVGTIKVGGDNSSGSAPADTADGTDLNADLADGYTEYSVANGDVIPRYMKVHIHAYTSGDTVIKMKVRRIL